MRRIALLICVAALISFGFISCDKGGYMLKGNLFPVNYQSQFIPLEIQNRANAFDRVISNRNDYTHIFVADDYVRKTYIFSPVIQKDKNSSSDDLLVLKTEADTLYSKSSSYIFDKRMAAYRCSGYKIIVIYKDTILSFKY